MPDDFLSGLLGNNKQQDFASPLQVEIAKLLAEKSAPQQQPVDMTIPGGWKGAVVNALGNINSAMYRNQALRVNQGIIGNNARTATNLVVRPQDSQPAIKPSVVMKEVQDIKPTVNPENTVKSIDESDKSNLGVQPEVKAIVWKNLSDQGKKQVGSVENVSSQDVIDFLSNHMLNGKTKYGASGIGIPASEGNLKFDQEATIKHAFDDPSKLPGRAQLTFDPYKTLNLRTAFPPDTGKQSFLDQSPEPQRGTLTDADMNLPGIDRRMGNPAAANMSIPGSSEAAKNILSSQSMPGGSEIAKNVMPQGQGVTDIDKLALGARELPQQKDPSQISQQDMGATPWSKAQEAAQAAQKGSTEQPIKPQGPLYLPDEQREIDSPLRPESAIGRTRMAQMLPDKTGKPGIPQGGNWINIPGYSGPAPSVPSLPSEKSIAERIHALAISGDMDSVNEFVQDIQKKMQPQVVKVPNGELYITPKHYPDKNEITFIPSAETKGISAGGVHTEMGPQFNEQGQLEQRLRVPGPTSGQGAGGGMNSLEDFATEGQRIGAQGEATSKIYGEKAGQITEAVTQGQKANNAIQRLDTMMALSKAGGAWTPAGPTKDTMLKMRQFLDNMGFPTKGTPEGEIFDKFNNFLASEATQAVTSRGTNFDLETFMRANPSLLQSKEGRESLIDILKQEYRARQYIGRRANELGGKDVNKLSSVVEEYYKSHPIKFNLRVGKEDRQINAYPVKQESDLDHIESGEWFIAPNGKMGRKP